MNVNEWNRRQRERSTAVAALPRVVVTDGWKPEPPLCGAGQVIKVLWRETKRVATVVSASSEGDVRLYLGYPGEWIECVLVREGQPASKGGSADA